MPRDQETSLSHEPAASDDPLFREPTGQYRDVPADGDMIPADAATDAPGEWVAGSKGPGHTADDATGLRPSAAPVDVDEDTVDTTGATETVGTADTAADLRTTRDPAVAPDSALAAEPEPGPGTEPARAGTAVPPADATVPPADTAVPAADAMGASGAPIPGAPGTAETTGVAAASAALVTNGDELHADWARIQSSFVDDPRQSVSQAADLVGQVTRSLVTAVQEREQTLRGSWEGQSGIDTEHLRNALRDYRAFFEHLVKL
jgi:hypothetical protein